MYALYIYMGVHVMYTYMVIYIDAKFGYVNGYACEFLHARTIACGR